MPLQYPESTVFVNAGESPQTYTTTSSIALVLNTNGATISNMTIDPYEIVVSSFQVYIEAFSPKIEFLNASDVVIYTIQTTANYLDATILKTFQVPNINMSSVTTFRFSSSSLINKTVIINGISVNRLICNLTYACAMITNSIYGPYGSVSSPLLPNLYTNVVALTGTTKGEYNSLTTITFFVGLNADSSTSIGNVYAVGKYVSSIQLYVAGVDLKFEFMNKLNVLHTVKTGTLTDANVLKTIELPNYDMLSVTQVRISSSVANSINVKGLNDYLLLCNITYATSTQPQLTPLTLFNIPNPSSTPFQTTLSAGATINQFGYTQTGLINYKPYYITIPSITLSSTGTPLQLSFSLFSGLKTYVTTTFSISSSYTTGLTIPLQSNYTGTGINTALTNTAGVAFTVTYPTTNAANAAPYLEANAAITGTLTYTGSASTIKITTAADLDYGWIVNLYGTDIIIDPTLAPSPLSVKTPITYSSAKTVGFTAATTTAPHAVITYTIYPTPATPTTTMTTLITTIATIPGTPGPNSFKLNVAPESGNGNVTIYANSSEVTGYKPKSMYAQSTVKNYAATLPSGNVVPFANTYNVATGPTTYATAFAGRMCINFTQNVILNALDFGYIFETFIKNGTNPNITNNGGYTATGATTTFTLQVEAANPYRSYGTINFSVTPNRTGNVYSALYTSSSNADGSNDGTLLSIPFTPTAATATATVSGGVISCTITNGGSGYIYPPSVIVTGTPNTAIAYATINSSGSVTGITFTSGNNGYVNAPTITFQVFNTATATAFVSASGVITATITNGGSGYVYPPEVVISGMPNTATATATISAGSVTGITIASSGNTGYSTAPTITIVAFRKPTATTAVNNGVISASITNGGSGYVYPPQVVVEGAPNTATATATINSSGSVTGITFTSGNAGYSTAPTITFLYSSAASARSEPETMSSIAMATSPPSFPTYVSGFTTDINSPFAFNVGDEITITLSTSNPGSVWTTPTTSTLGVQPGLPFPLGEMCGALICTPNTVGNPIYNPQSVVVYNASPVTTDAVLSSFISVSSPPSTSLSGTIILTGFRFSGIKILPSDSSLPAVQIGLRADIYRGASVIFQVFFNYIESSSTAAPLYIPFSYAEYVSVGTANLAWVSRIVPTSMYFNQPQNPIFYTGEIFSIKLVNTNNSNTSLVCIYRKNVVSETTYAAGSLWGISENLPTITTPSPTITPIFYNGLNVTYITIPKPVSTNTTSGFTYVTPFGHTYSNAASPTIGLGGSFNLVTYPSLTAYQDSSTTFSKSLPVSYPAFQVINTLNASNRTAYSMANSRAGFTWTPTYIINATKIFKFAQAIGMFDSTSRILGLSFQHFGGFTVNVASSVTIYISITSLVTESNRPTSPEVSINYTLLPSTGKNGTMTFIPFSPDFYGTNMEMKPTNVTNLTYTGNLNDYASYITPGSIISISYTVSGGTSDINIIDNDTNANMLEGSLVISKSTNYNTINQPVYDYAANNVAGANWVTTLEIVNNLYVDVVVRAGVLGTDETSNIIMKGIKIPTIEFSTRSYPIEIKVTMAYGSYYTYTIAIVLINGQNAFEQVGLNGEYIELTMPDSGMKGSYELRYTHGYYINAISVNTSLRGGVNARPNDAMWSTLRSQKSYPIFRKIVQYTAGSSYYDAWDNYFNIKIISNSNSFRLYDYNRPPPADKRCWLYFWQRNVPLS